MAAPKNDPFSFDIQIDTVLEDRGPHRLGKNGEVQRADVFDDDCLGLLLQARIDRIVHGHEKSSKKPATLVVFGFRFHGLGEGRRFRSAKITILFRDAKKRDDDEDPVVVALWPDGDFVLGDKTEVAVDKTRSLEAGAKVGNDQAGFNASGKWERKEGFKKHDRATLTGTIFLDEDVRQYGANNAVRLTLKENAHAGYGLVNDFRAAVLLHRNSETDDFHATVRMDAKADFGYNAARTMRDLAGFSPPNDPVLFRPGVQYLRPASLARFAGTNLAVDIEEDKLSADVLDGLVGVMTTQVLLTSEEGLRAAAAATPQGPAADTK